MEAEITNEIIDRERRKLLVAAGTGAMAMTFGGIVRAQTSKTLRWGIVGTGGIAHSMAPRIQQADNAELVAVSSRKMATAKEFADSFGMQHAFDSWADMLAFDGVDAIYIATPTSVKEEISLAAARAGKHVLCEKPFADLPSVRRITAACRENGVGFMDGTHFPHHPRTAYIKAKMSEMVGQPWSVASAFQFLLTDTGNIRMNTELEPYGAIGDTGWYNMRAAVEYLPADIEITSVETFMRRSPETGAAVSGSGVIVFGDGSTTTWNCGFNSGAGIQDLRISGPAGVIKINDFLSQRPSDQAGVYEYLTGWRNSETGEVPSEKPGSALMFEDFAAMVGDPGMFEASVRASERTQMLLDAVWNSALRNE
jgi:predicted dehydrogenase